MTIPNKNLDVMCNDIEYWKTQFWDLVYKRGGYVEYLRQLNEKQASRIMELELLLSFVKRSGNTVHIDSQTMYRLINLYDDQKDKSGLKRSRYYRNDK